MAWMKAYCNVAEWASSFFGSQSNGSSQATGRRARFAHRKPIIAVPGSIHMAMAAAAVGADGNFHVISELEYAKAVQGCAVRMLTRPGQSCGRPPLPSNAEVTEAITRLRRRFAFVGLLEEWELSICLLHVRFGLGLCEAVEMSNTRPGPMASRSNTTHRHSGYNVSVLRGFTDPYDGPLYQEAQVIFRAQLDEYNVTKELCQELRCWPVMK
eukprot:CAMPEP_0115863948 /NCGR_PEP_ID=MMETSP0287-20121206/18948_1 /TAXON_ID=412157 /ORGANISM="Chrysochromulina rotalis, Strain UIO044" /LENGTH=211 /DNA_ID=CAMNT_0003318403 /DNA_START=595 /DNA_END=1229 /DNA_ORIENTATION=-